MKRFTHWFLAACFCVLTTWVSQGTAQGQFRYNPAVAYAQQQRFFQAQMAAQQNQYVQQLFNNQVYQVYSTAYNGGPVNPNSYYPTYTPPYYPPTPFGNPYVGPVVNPYTPSGAGYGYGANPYSPTDSYGAGNQYNPYSPYNQNNSYGSGSVLSGSADLLRAYGSAINSQEQARLLREQVLQAKQDTRKKIHDTDMYIKATTPTYTQEQDRIAKSVLGRIQRNSLPGEVSNGKALNLLLDDLRKFPGKKVSIDAIPLSEAILTHLNVTTKTFGLGVLRDGGKVVWPGGLQERMTVKQRQDLDKQLQSLVREANNDRLDANVLKDVRHEIEQLREELVKKFNDIPAGQYMDSKRFLDEMYQSTVALERREAPNQAKFQRFAEGGKSVQELADYMVKEGLRFAPATADDEAAYRAVHSAMASHDIAMNSQFAPEAKE